MDATVKRVADGVEEPTYAFDVTTTGGSAVRGWPHTIKIFFGAVTIARDEAPLGMTLWVIEDQIINGLGGAVALLISIIITAFFIPNMLRKGSVDLLISKPIGRSQLLIYKYIGGLTFIFLRHHVHRRRHLAGDRPAVAGSGTRRSWWSSRS